MSIQKRLIHKLLFLFFGCFASYPVNAQLQNLHISDYKHWQVSSTLVLYEPLRLTHDGRELLHSLPALSGELAGSRYFGWDNGWGVSFGLGFGINTYNTHFRFQAPENSPFDSPDYPSELELFYTDYDGLYFCLPVDVSKSYKTGKDRIMLFSAGFKLNVQNIHPKGRPYTWEVGLIHEIDQQNYQVFLSRYSTTGPFVVPSFHLKYGIQKSFKKLNSLNYCVVLQWSPYIIRQGTYTFENLTYISKGTMRQSINFLGLEACYRMKPR